MASSEQMAYDRQIAIWLMVCAAVIIGMILLGGITRLTHSGLSMVEWKPLMGIIPPLSEQAWMETFDKYKQFPEYQKINLGMTLQGFKAIFMYEYLHRLLGRLIGVLFFFPFLYFAIKGRIRTGLMPKLIALFILGALQGLLGWYMVMSGLVNDPHVSQYRLTAHLGLAVLIYAYMFWLAIDLWLPSGGVCAEPLGRYKSWSTLLVGLVFLMILSGGLVAGTRAGFAYSTWPLMGNSFIPQGLYTGSPAWISAFEDVTTIQFNHRMFAYLLLVVISWFSFGVYTNSGPGRARTGAIALFAMLLIQAVLGVLNLLLHVPVALAAAHQGGAVVLLTAALFVCHALRRP
ncbi:MAG: heme A synthase [Halieaceae bacterium]|jgi:heme a synthase|nr:heme A synthase [Halieaceae bacterium]